MRKPTVIDLFCGAGGLSKGFEMAGYNILLGIDFDKYSIKTFQENHKTAGIILDDIKNVDAKRIRELIGDEEVDVIVGGPPCQGFSMAGRRDQNDPRNSLFAEFVRIVNDLKPKWFVMENVTGLLITKTAGGEDVGKIIKREFGKIGYKVENKILIAADYGVAQRRRRVFFIGTNTGEQIRFPFPTHSKTPQVLIDGTKLKRWVPVSSLLLKEDEVPKGYFHGPKMIEGFVRRKRVNVENGKGFGWQILRPDEPSFTISARYWKDGSDALVMYSPDRVRMLTERECARIQSFPDDFVFTGPKREVYKQIGNAVPPLLAKTIAEIIKNYLGGKTVL